MIRYDRRLRLLAACLSAIAGYVDALGFLKLGGFFVSFMSGNSTRLAVGVAERSSNALIAGGLIGVFLLGVVLGSLAGHVAQSRRQTVVLGLVALLLFAAATFDGVGLTRLAIVAIGLAMGAENTVFERDGEVSIGLTYMTGTLVKLGQRITAALLGGDRFSWVPYLVQWIGLVTGACIGALVYPALGLGGLWIAAIALSGCAIAAKLMEKKGKTAPRG